MMSAQEQVQRWTETGSSAAGIARMRQLARSPATRALGDGPSEIEVSKALALWTFRQESTQVHNPSVVGMRDLLRALRQLPPARRIQQIALKRGEETGLIFYDPETNLALGTVIAKQSGEDVRHSRENFRMATQPPRPVSKVRVEKAIQQTA